MYKKRHRLFALALVLLLTLGAATASALGSMMDNMAPVAENLEIDTYRGVSVGGRLNAVDPDGDTLTYAATTAPTKGELEISEDGRFVYTPADNKRGKDYFGYKAMDSEGNLSQEATVIIRIQRQKTNVDYTDTAGLSCDYAAHVLAENGIFVGQYLGGQYVFEPERGMSRGEFLSMCIDIAGIEPLSGVRSTGFTDDADIPAWVKPYVSTALLTGAIAGYAGENGAIFDAAACVSQNEAAVMINRLLQITDVTGSSAWTSDTVPIWATQAVSNLAACNVIYPDAQALSRGLTRAEAAEMLVRTMTLLK